MCGVTLLCVGKMKEKYYTDAFAEYQKLLGAFCRFELEEIPEQRLGDDPGEKEIAAALEKEAAEIEKRIPAMMRMFAKYGIDIRKEPILVYPTLHYQNGGLKISTNGQTDIENLYAAGEVVGGIHGRNRLMGNSLLDIIVFGRNAGKEASEKAKSVQVGQLTLEHLKGYNALREEAAIADDTVSPRLLPDYARKENRGK